MPARPARPCTYPGCGVLTNTKEARCDEHATTWEKTGPQVKRKTGEFLRKARKRLFQRNPLCVMCERQGKVTLAVIRDHIVPLTEGGADEEFNTQGLCEACHAIKSDEEAKRGVKRYLKPGNGA